MYKDINEYLKANTHKAYEIAKKLKGEDKEELIDTLDFLRHKLVEDHRIMKWHEDAIREVVSDEQYNQIVKLYMAYMNNDFLANSPWGREMEEKGLMKPAGVKILFQRKGEENG